MSKFQPQTRATNMGMAFVEAAAKAMRGYGGKIDKAIRDPKVHWVARRIAVGQGKVGTITEPTTIINIMNPEERKRLIDEKRALGVL